MAINFKEEDYGWVFNFRNCVVRSIKIDFRFGLLLTEGDETFELQVETPFSLKRANGVVSCIPEDPKSMGPILSLGNLEVVSIEIQRTGQMHINFGSDFSMTINPDRSYEAWQLSGSSGFLFVCPPEGGVTFFTKTTE